VIDNRGDRFVAENPPATDHDPGPAQLAASPLTAVKPGQPERRSGR
jgi:hypothetical protein